MQILHLIHYLSNLQIDECVERCGFQVQLVEKADRVRIGLEGWQQQQWHPVGLD